MNYRWHQPDPRGHILIPGRGQGRPEAHRRLLGALRGGTDNEPDPSLARLALQAYAPEGLNQPDKAKEAVRIIAADSNDTQTYLLLVQYATTAGDTRLANLAGQKAVDLAPKNVRKEVEKQVEQLKKPPTEQTPDG